MALRYDNTTGMMVNDDNPNDPYNLYNTPASSSFTPALGNLTVPSGTSGMTLRPVSSSGSNSNVMFGNTSLMPSGSSGGLSASSFLGNTSANEGLGFNLGTLNMAASAIGGVGSLAKGYAAMKGLGLAEEELEFKRGAFERNFAQQKQAYDDTVRQYNNAQGERQAFVNATHANPSLSSIKTLELA